LPPQIFEYNGSAVVAMVGKNCFAIASDRRLGVQLQTIATDFQRVFKIHDKLYIGLSGLATDAQTLWVSRILDSLVWATPGDRTWFRVWV
jgi:20S proteasome alpha/beta subunit